MCQNLSLLHCLYYDRELVMKKTNCFYFTFFRFLLSFIVHIYNTFLFEWILLLFSCIISCLQRWASVFLRWFIFINKIVSFGDNFNKRYFVPLQVCHNNVKSAGLFGEHSTLPLPVASVGDVNVHPDFFFFFPELIVLNLIKQTSNHTTVMTFYSIAPVFIVLFILLILTREKNSFSLLESWIVK